MVVADVRWYLDVRSGRAAYERGHIPGAVFVELEQWLAGAPHPDRGRHPLPDPTVFAQGMAQLGIADEDTVIAYDDAGGVIAARLVCMLRAIGQEAALLTGGIAGYDGPLETQPVIRSPATFSLRPWPAAQLADIAYVATESQIVIDARDRARYRGDDEPIDPRAGHIPGAHNLPCRESLDADGALLPHDELRQHFNQLGVTPGSSVISYRGIRRHGLPQPARHGARRVGARTPLPGVLVAVQPY